MFELIQSKDAAETHSFIRQAPLRLQEVSVNKHSLLSPVSLQIEIHIEFLYHNRF